MTNNGRLVGYSTGIKTYGYRAKPALFSAFIVFAFLVCFDEDSATEVNFGCPRPD